VRLGEDVAAQVLQLTLTEEHAADKTLASIAEGQANTAAALLDFETTEDIRASEESEGVESAR
jgi:hypothetical protein